MQKAKAMQPIQIIKMTHPKRNFSVLSALEVEYLPEIAFGYMIPDLYAQSALSSPCRNEPSANQLENNWRQKETKYA